MKTSIFKKTILVLCFSIFCWNAAFDLLRETKNTFFLFKKFYGLSDSQKRTALFSADWLLLDKISYLIPESSNVLLHTANANEMLFWGYALSPRKIFVDPNFVPSEHKLNLNWQWLERKRISWIVLRMAENQKLIRILNIDDNKILQEILLSS